MKLISSILLFCCFSSKIQSLLATNSNCSFLTPSIFPNISPYLKFKVPIICEKSAKNTKERNETSEECYKILQSIRWGRMRRNKLTHFLKPIIFLRSQTSSTKWHGSWDTRPISSTKGKPSTKAVLSQEYQKYNFIPGVEQLGLKDLQWNLYKRVIKKQNQTLQSPIFLKSFILPKEFKMFKSEWEKNEDKVWIVKPVRNSLSRGIYLITHWNQLKSASRRVFVQKYLTDPYLVNSRKGNIRVFALVTSTMPIRAYISYESNLRLGFQNFSMDPTSINNTCIHILSQGKCKSAHDDSSSYIHLKDFFTNYLSPEDEQIIKNQIELNIKQLLYAVQNVWWRKSEAVLFNRYNAFNLLSFDFLMDSLKNPILIESNSAPLVLSEKYCNTSKWEGISNSAGVMTEVLNIVGYQVQPFMKNLYTFEFSKEEAQKHSTFMEQFRKLELGNGTNSKSKITDYNNLLDSIVEDLTPDDVRVLMVAMDEESRSGPYFKKLLPESQTLPQEDGRNEGYKFLLGNADKNPSLYYFLLFEGWNKHYGTNVTNQIGLERLKQLASQKLHL